MVERVSTWCTGDIAMTASDPSRSEEQAAVSHLIVADSGKEDVERLIGGVRNEAAAPIQMYVGKVNRCIDPTGIFSVLIEDGECIDATLSSSCFLAPQDGDLVQVLVGKQRCWIAQVLERFDPYASHTLNLGFGEVVMTAGSLHLKAETKLHFQAQDMRTNVESIHENAFRKRSEIQGWSTIRAGFLDLHAERQLNLFSNVTTLVSESLLKVDGAQIHMG